MRARGESAVYYSVKYWVANLAASNEYNTVQRANRTRWLAGCWLGRMQCWRWIELGLVA